MHVLEPGEMMARINIDVDDSVARLGGWVGVADELSMGTSETSVSKPFAGGTGTGKRS